MKRDLTGRGSWWLETLKDTPIPGHYCIRNFLEEAALNPVKRTYGFKAQGREARDVWPRRGELLLPGAYDYTDAIQEALKRRASCSFRSRPRSHDLTLMGIRDKDNKTSPCDYNVMEKPVEKTPCKHVVFRSAVQRISFPLKEGPAPGRYNLQAAAPTKGITSCFKSRLPRLHSIHSRTPGPGSYLLPWQLGQQPNTEAMAVPAQGLFFRDFF
ncbi:Protein STPG4 [Merluccius polli]|uniref:Protein STPG4 n=1 Tax=Merluccius polli TaxID=89951 RepID=A0AA47NCM6_MERPO|nr:Protein STPG4 [Merluccius polli]